MKATAIPLVLGVLGAALVMGDHALACGDKLVVTGRGLRAGRVRSVPPASILLYADPAGALPAALDQGHLRKDLEKAGHRLRSVETLDDLKAALDTGSYDLVFADSKEATAVETEANRAASRPTVLPTLFNPTDAELAAASSHYQCVVRAPGQPRDYMTVVNEALAQRVRQAQAGNKK